MTDACVSPRGGPVTRASARVSLTAGLSPMTSARVSLTGGPVAHDECSRLAD
jgi:hypothetical protein